MPPSFGYKTHELMQDIAFATGAKYFSEKTGDDLSIITMADLGYADKIIVSKSSTLVVTVKMLMKKRLAKTRQQR